MVGLVISRTRSSDSRACLRLPAGRESGRDSLTDRAAESAAAVSRVREGGRAEEPGEGGSGEGVEEEERVRGAGAGNGRGHPRARRDVGKWGVGRGVSGGGGVGGGGDQGGGGTRGWGDVGKGNRGTR